MASLMDATALATAAIHNPASSLSAATTGSFEPTEGCLLVVAVYHWNSPAAGLGDVTISQGHAGAWTWTKRATSVVYAPGGEIEQVQLWTAVVPASPGSGTLTITGPGAQYYLTASVFEVDGVDLDDPVVQVGTDPENEGTSTVTLSSSPDEGNLVVGVAISLVDASTAPTIGPGSGWTDIAGPVFEGPSYAGRLRAQARDDASTTVGWTWTTAPDYSAALAVEFLAAEDPGGPPPDPLVFDSDRTGNFEIYKIDTGGTVTQLTDDDDYDSWWPKVSPDGSKILFIRSPEGTHDSDLTTNALWVMDADGGNQTELLEASLASGTTPFAGWYLLGHPEWSPDGSKIVLIGGFLDLYVIDADGTNPTLISRGTQGGQIIDPSWSADGESILYIWFYSETFSPSADNQVYRVAATGGTPTQITSNAYVNFDPYESPDGERIAWLAQTDGNPAGILNWSIRLADNDGTNQEWLINDGWVNSKPKWSPDGERIYFHRTSGDPFFSLHWLPVESPGAPNLIAAGDGSNEYPAIFYPPAAPSRIKTTVHIGIT